MLLIIFTEFVGKKVNQSNLAQVYVRQKHFNTYGTVARKLYGTVAPKSSIRILQTGSYRPAASLKMSREKCRFSQQLHMFGDQNI